MDISIFKVKQNAEGLQCSLAHQLLPKEEQTKPEEVCRNHVRLGAARLITLLK